ncbi:helix-turn-helix transcriptional regulator [Desulfosporosinus sp. PR]|uniref:helix-turn-helix domain-containing protein n=1 Tax=Candidatus Desulfosporosinus nitrosoreducens TaxID=3401928 RepID=UPI0027F3D701|nr:helix-turn-helix transcriptional regulator [Desulfosporosinus sp. PR]MDQ7095007.1 helix-turn-helix transcriptional regulator [Desulfosporosinus sp. PR]
MIGKRLKELRGDRTQDEVALRLGIKRARYALYEQNRTEPNIEMLQKLSKYHNVSIDYILGKTDEKTTDNTQQQDEITEYLETLHKRPEMKTLFKISKNATKKDIEKAIKIIEALKEDTQE